jgi:hypothetical protein
VSDWTWEYLPTTEEVVGGFSPEMLREVEQFGQRFADAAGVKYLGDPPIEESGVSGVIYFVEGPWLIGYMEHRRQRTIYLVRVVNPQADGA